MARQNQSRWSGSLSLILLVTLVTLTASHPGQAAPYCSESGTSVQVLGSGGSELDDERAAPSYIVWVDGRARVLIDTGPGSALRFEMAGARYEDLDAIVYSQLRADHAADFAAYIDGSYYTQRTRPLPVFGPNGNETTPSMTEFVFRMIGPNGAFPYLKDFLSHADGYKVNSRNVPSVGSRIWSRFQSEAVRLSSVPVHHGDTPALAWRIDTEHTSVTFTGDASNRKLTIEALAQDTGILVAHHVIPEGARGRVKNLYMEPSQIGRVAKRSRAGMLILTSRMSRTRGRESLSRTAIEAHYQGPIIFGSDLDCWGVSP